jgi:hypothetical protein
VIVTQRQKQRRFPMLYRNRHPALSESALVALGAILAIVPIGGLFGGLYLLAQHIANAL